MKKNIFFILFLFFCCSAYAQPWPQIGQDIDGEAASDNSGAAVSLSADGSIVAIGANLNDGNGSDAGQVRIYENIAGTWTQIGSDIDGEAAGDYTGCAVSLSADGSFVAIGAKYNDGSGSNAGHVRIYENIAGTWTQIGSDIDGEAANDYSGWSVSLSADGSIVAIGANSNDGNGSSAGHVRVYQNIAGTWSQIGSDIDGEAVNDNSGYSVSISADGSIVAIGAQYNDGNGSNAGHARVYENIAGTWTQIGSDIDAEAADDRSGYSVSVNTDGSILAIGAIYNDGFGSNAGHARVYENIAGTWTQIGSDIDAEAVNDNSGYSVSISADGSIVAIGAHYNDGNGSNAGHVRVYENIAGTWTQIGSDIDGEAADDRSGSSVSVSADGSIVAIGAIGNDGNGSNAGHVRIFKNIVPVITTQPVDQTSICPEEIVEFSVSGEYITAWEWQVNNGGPWVSLSDDAVYSGTDSETLSLVSDITLNTYQYRCIISNAFGEETSNVAIFYYTGISTPVPADMAASVSVNQDLSWNPSSVALSYDVYFGEKGSMSFIGNQTETTYDPGVLLYSNEYDWAIYSVTAGGTESCDKVWKFTTEQNSGPPEGYGVSVNNTGDAPNAYAVLDLNVSTHDKGVLIPRLTTTQRTGLNLLGASEEGLIVYDSETDSFWFWDSSQWKELAVSAKNFTENKDLLEIIEKQNKDIDSLQKRVQELESFMNQQKK